MDAKAKGLSSASLHIIAMLCMLLDHAWITVVSGNSWMNCVGRLAFPIFAFMIAEGCRHTHDIKKYMLRMLVFALISEPVFDFMLSGSWFFPSYQNVMWTFLIAIGCVYLIQILERKAKPLVRWLCTCLIAASGVILGYALITDYYGMGVLTVLVFYLFPGKKPLNMLIQLATLWWINFEVFGGIGYSLYIGAHELFIPRQGLAVLAVIPIFLYNGRRGCHSKLFQYFCYAFYPLHCLILGLLAQYS